ncbi:MAG: hypothetical protein U0165_09210 [Polyangiaceae bacterium]
MVEWLQGDDDGDFVPNTRDICPNTPELAATDLRGCVVDDSTVAHAPPADEVNAAIKLAGGLLYNEACKDAPIPNPPTPLRLHAGGLVSDPADMNSANTLLNFSMMPTNNQPADCPVYYELMANIEGLPGGSIVARRTFKASELPAAVGEGLPHVDYVSGAVAHCEFVRNGDLATEPRIPCTTAVGVPALKAVTLPAGVSGYWRVRAVNGAGVASPWSDLPVRQQTLYDQQ